MRSPREPESPHIPQESLGTPSFEKPPYAGLFLEKLPSAGVWKSPSCDPLLNALGVPGFGDLGELIRSHGALLRNNLWCLRSSSLSVRGGMKLTWGRCNRATEPFWKDGAKSFFCRALHDSIFFPRLAFKVNRLFVRGFQFGLRGTIIRFVPNKIWGSGGASKPFITRISTGCCCQIWA